MPLNVTVINKEVAPLEIDFMGEKIKIKYKPNAYTQKFMDDHRDDNIAETLLHLLTEWDIQYTPDGSTKTEPLPLTKDGMDQLPYPAVRAIWEGIINSILPNPTKQTNGGSFT